MNTRRQNLGEDVPSQQNLLLRKEERFYSRLGGLLPARPLPTVGKHRGISGALRGGFLQVLGMRRRLGPKCSICAHDKRHLIEVALTYKDTAEGPGRPLQHLAARALASQQGSPVGRNEGEHPQRHARDQGRLRAAEGL
jgi:hypothetical protein